MTRRMYSPDERPLPSDGLLLIYLKSSCSHEYNGEPVVVRSHGYKLKTTVYPVRIDPDDVLFWSYMADEADPEKHPVDDDRPADPNDRRDAFLQALAELCRRHHIEIRVDETLRRSAVLFLDCDRSASYGFASDIIDIADLVNGPVADEEEERRTFNPGSCRMTSSETMLRAIDELSRQLEVVRREAAYIITVQHVEAAKGWPDWAEMLAWAITNGATVAEMQLWRKAQHGEECVDFK